jgi:nucleoside-diphosphate-sugar epimerase
VRETTRIFLAAKMSFLELEGLHVFVTGAAGGIGSAIVEEFLGK